MTKQLHEVNFQSADHYNLWAFTRFLNLSQSSGEDFSIEEQEWRDRYKVSVGDVAWFVEHDFLPKFWLMLEEDKFDELRAILEEGKLISHIPIIAAALIDSSYDENNPSFQLVGEDYLNVDRRASGLVKAIGLTIREIAELINKEQEKVLRDGKIVKDFDGILTFNTPAGGEFKVELCFDKVPPVSNELENYVIERTPITKEDLETYLGETGPKILSRLDHVNSLVKALFESKAIANNKILYEYAEMCINAVIVTAFLNQTINYIAFGGIDNWKSDGTETANNKACFVYLDQEVDKIFSLLESIPKTEGVEHYSIEINTFAIFGRADNRVVTPALQGYTHDILKGYSHGFERVLSARLNLIDSVHVFKS